MLTTYAKVVVGVEMSDLIEKCETETEGTDQVEERLWFFDVCLDRVPARDEDPVDPDFFKPLGLFRKGPDELYDPGEIDSYIVGISLATVCFDDDTVGLITDLTDHNLVGRLNVDFLNGLGQVCKRLGSDFTPVQPSLFLVLNGSN